MAAHWVAYEAADGKPPAEQRCFADEHLDDAVGYLSDRLAEREQQARVDVLRRGRVGDEWYDTLHEYECGYEEMGERFADLYRADPAEWIGMGPAVLVVGFDYVIEGCNGAGCLSQAAST